MTDDEARRAVVEAVKAVEKADEKMDDIVAMLKRHFRLGVVAVFSAVLLGTLLVILTSGVRSTQHALQASARFTKIQTVTNEVEVLRHRIHSKEGDLRLCTVALGARLGEQEAGRVCHPVLGDEYEATKAKLAAEEARLERLRNS